ncbi:Retrovirus-related Pol polyprotein from transposon TNT 1-94 [Linum perenne]
MPDPDDPEFDAWDQSNTTVIAWIINSLDREISEVVIDNDNALETEYYNRLKNLWTEYVSFRPIPACECGEGRRVGTCNTYAAVKSYQENDHVIDFIIGLNDEHENTKSQLLLMEPPPTLKVVSKFAMKLERQIKGISKEVKTVDTIALAGSQTREWNKSKDYGLISNNNAPPATETGLFCRYCKRTNHNIEDCYRRRNRNHFGNNYNSGSNYNTGNYGSANGAFSGDQQAEHPIENQNTRQDHNGSLRFTSDDYNRLMALLQQNSNMASSSSSPSPTISHQANFTARTMPTTPTAYPNYTGIITLSSHQTNHNLYLPDSWIIDTGASDHMCNSLKHFISYKPASNIRITLPNNSSVPATHIRLAKSDNGLLLHDALYVPNFAFNLISVSKLTKTLPVSLLFESNVCKIQDLATHTMTGFAREAKGLYQLQTSSTLSAFQQHKPFVASTYNLQPQEINLWHCRLGHLSNHTTQILSKCNPDLDIGIVAHCEECHLSIQKKLPFPSSMNISSEPFALIHTDIWGPLRVISHDGHAYFLTIVDDYTRAVWIFLMKHKSEASSLLQTFCHMAQRQFNKKVKTIRSDQGLEFHMKEFYAREGIEHQMSCVERQEQNGRVERKQQDILNIARALRFQSGLPLIYWSYCVLHAVHILNRLPTPLLSNQTPYMYNTSPDYSHLKVFGCLCYASSLDRHKTKFDHRARQCVYLGVAAGIKGHKLLDLNTKQVFVSRDVLFHESIFPFRHHMHSSEHTHSHLHDPVASESLFPASPFHTNLPDFEATRGPSNAHSVEDGSPISATPHEELLHHQDSSITSPTSSHQNHISQSPQSSPSPLPSDSPPSPSDSPQITRRSSRNTRPPPYLADYITSHAKSNYPITSFTTYDQLSSKHKLYALNTTNLTEPRTFDEAVKEEHWRNAMRAELQALEDNQTWDIVDCPEGKKPVGCRWVYKIKLQSDGRIERYKARLVAKGFTQVYGIDFLDTFSPVVKMNTVKLLLAVAATKQWHLEQMDISNAFLHGDLEEEVYMDLPQGIHGIDRGKVCKLRKSLYGLKQASRQWFSKLTEALQRFGFIQSLSDYSLFTKSSDRGNVIMLVYVDDLIISGDSMSLINEVKQFLGTEFKVRDLGKLKYFLGLEVARSSAGISVCQRKYALELLKDTCFLDCKPIKTPVDMKTRLSKEDGNPLLDISEYRTLVGKLNYLVTTRPDIAYSVQQLCQFQAEPCSTHMQAAHRILRYVKGTPGQGLFFSSSNELILKGYNDADWGACPYTRKSITGYCTFLGDLLITWKAKKQSTVSKSSSEAEYMALSQLSCEVQWLKQLLRDMFVPHESTISIYCDNKSSIHMAENPVFHERTKHIEIDCHVIKERIKSGLITLKYVCSDRNLADVFTKGLSSNRFQWMLFKLGVHDIYSPACGGDVNRA